MERTSNCCTLASLVALVILVSFPVRSWCKEDAYKSQTVAKPECCVREEAELKRFGDMEYDSFVGLMGRSVAQPTRQTNTPLSKKRHMDPILAALLRKTRMACPCAKEYLQTNRGQLVSHGWQRGFCSGDVTPAYPQHMPQSPTATNPRSHYTNRGEYVDVI